MAKQPLVEQVILLFFPQYRLPLWLTKKIKPYKVFGNIVKLAAKHLSKAEQRDMNPVKRFIPENNKNSTNSSSSTIDIGFIGNNNKASSDKKKTANKMQLPAKIGIGSGVTLVLIILFAFIAFPKLIHFVIRKMLVTTPGSLRRDLYVDTPFPFVFKVYMFNITNPEDITLRGAKPIVQEVGPFIYDEWKTKVNLVDNEADDTLVFRMKDTFIFNPTLSGKLTGNEIVTIPHPLIAGMAMTVIRDKPALATLLNKGINSIFKNPTTPFVTASVNDILFGGLEIDCTVTDFAGKAVCAQLKIEAEGLIETRANVYKISFFGPKNGTAGKLFEVYRGKKKSHDLGRIIAFDEKPEMSNWGSKKCNKYTGTDSTIFPPFLTKEEGLKSYIAPLCRSFNAYYMGDNKYDGISCWKYTADFGDASAPENKCYCYSPTSCLKKGVIDLMKCVKIPVMGSLPHFYLADESYINGVQGLNPNEKDHAIYIFFESLTGSPLSYRQRLQISMPFKPSPKITTFKTVPDVVIPMFWFEEGIDLNKTWTHPLKFMFITIKLVKIVKWLVAVLSTLGLGAAGFLHYKNKKRATITPVHAAPEPEELGTKKNDIVSMLNSNEYGGHFDGMVKEAVDTSEEKY